MIVLLVTDAVIDYDRIEHEPPVACLCCRVRVQLAPITFSLLSMFEENKLTYRLLWPWLVASVHSPYKSTTLWGLVTFTATMPNSVCLFTHIYTKIPGVGAERAVLPTSKKQDFIKIKSLSFITWVPNLSGHPIVLQHGSNHCLPCVYSVE